MQYLKGFAYGIKEGTVLSVKVIIALGYILSVVLLVALKLTVGTIGFGARVIEAR
jgi:hypothetical protein